MTSIHQQDRDFHSRIPGIVLSAITLMGILLTLASTRVQAQIPTPTVLYPFQGGTTDVFLPTGVVAQGRDGNLYGTAQSRGENANGGVYKVTPTGTETLIVSFPSDWQNCQGLALAFDGNFYGTCWSDGAYNDGFVFRVTPTGTLTDIYDFTAEYDDANPNWVPVLGANGDLYGTTGYTNGACGNIYRVSTAGTGYKNIQGGPGYCTPSAISAGSDGNFYGAWHGAPNSGDGAVYKVTAAGAYEQIFDFSGDPSGDITGAGVILARNGKLYGTDSEGGADGNGAIYSLTTNGKTLTDLFSIDDSTSGTLEYNNLLQASNGNFYGASLGGGAYNAGTFYELTSANVFSEFTLPASNSGSEYGFTPYTPLMQHTNGTVYGTTSDGGTDGYGVVLQFHIGASGFIALVSPVPAATEGTEVQILGQHFTSSSVVKFGGTAATEVKVSGSTFIEATVPSGALTGPITVTTSSGTLSTLLTFDVTPTAPSFTPTSGDAGTVVTITGTGLTQTTEVKFNGTEASSFTVVSDSEITATVPTGATTGAISVATKGGIVITKSKFTVD
jgi:uncharacterized repeat protein (TIGR03803 family)